MAPKYMLARCHHKLTNIQAYKYKYFNKHNWACLSELDELLTKKKKREKVPITWHKKKHSWHIRDRDALLLCFCHSTCIFYFSDRKEKIGILSRWTRFLYFFLAYVYECVYNSYADISRSSYVVVISILKNFFLQIFFKIKFNNVVAAILNEQFTAIHTHIFIYIHTRKI